MKKLITISFFAICSVCSNSWAQIFPIDPVYYTIFDRDSLAGFDEAAARQSAIDENFLGSEFKIKMYRLKRDYINNKYNLYTSRPAPSVAFPLARPAALPGCVNEDFEASTPAVITASNQVLGWTVTGGYNGFLSNPPPVSNTVSPYFPNGLGTNN